MGIVARQLPQPVMSSGGASTGTMTQQQPQQTALQQQSNGTAPGSKKGLSGGSSGGPTPVGTPVQNGTSGQQGPSPPPLTNAPKYGTLVPNRIFVGGISASTTEGELMQLFSSYGTVKAAKIIQDRAGVSKGYGFITFESEDDARRPLRDPDNIVLRERRLNIAPAIKKQPFGRPPAAPPYDGQQADGRSPAPAPHQATLQPPMPPFFFGGGPPFYPGAAAYYAAPPVPTMVSTAAAQTQVQVSQASQEHAAAAAAQQAVYQAPPVYQAQTGPPQAGPYASMMFPQAIYMPQQYPMMPYDYTVYGAGAAASHTNGGVPPPFATSGPPSNGGASPPRGPCYAPAPGPPEATIVYAGPPPHHIFHPAALDPTGGGPGPMYATADGSFDHMGPHAAAMGPFGAMVSPYGMNEQEGTFLERPEGSGTPRSYLTATPPSEQRSTATPVVSILSLDHQQEKDPASMQGGRRPPQQNAQQGNMHLHHHQSHQQQRRGGYQMNGQRRPMGRPFTIQHNTHHMQPPPPASFIPPVRRPRKPPRRSGPGNTANEIGAGDAPLPGQDEGLVAQVEALKI